ncbi:hypothetical protein [Nocardioides rubriscoriae]|uniref:hypothetical protein n=1 Tax=Nocardioides rubriscoriae TaxID=642762 RepID=UPI001B86E116|nr:hypothetical protein [Nocardioides rubriscoriae]
MTTRPGRRPPVRVVAGAVALVAAAALSLATPISGSILTRDPTWQVNQVTPAQMEATVDEFGVAYLHPTLRDGTYWVAQWDAPRSFDGVDPQDAWFDADHGSATYEAGGGELRIGGDLPRMYVHDPQRLRQWRDVEVTMYVKRLADAGIPFAGFTAVARANHLRTEEGRGDLCDTRGYGGRLRFDGHADFEKETAHPHNEAHSNRLIYAGGMPKDVWLGVKFVVVDQADGVHLELWLDEDDGRDGGDWELVDEMVDDGGFFGRVPCAPGIDPTMPLTSSPSRAGSESGLPNLSVYFRSDGIAPGGLLYKWGSIREIAS